MAFAQMDVKTFTPSMLVFDIMPAPFARIVHAFPTNGLDGTIYGSP